MLNFLKKIARLLIKCCSIINSLIIGFKIKNDIKSGLNVSTTSIRTLFVPYNSIDCLTLHRGFRFAFWLNGISSTQLVEIGFMLNPIKYLSFDHSSVEDVNNFSSFQCDLKTACSERNLINLYLPILDSVIRVADANNLFKSITISETLFNDLEKVIFEFDKLAKDHTFLFLADGAYLGNYILKERFLKYGKRVFYLNPSGTLAEYSVHNICEFSLLNFSEFPTEFNNSKISTYLDSRFSGGNKSQVDASLAFEDSVSPKQYEVRKVLFLHAFRDANNMTWYCDQPYASYIDWTYSTIKWISQNDDWDNWYIKIHPVSNYYDSEDVIFRNIVSNFQIPKSVYESVPSTRVILKSRMPVYTNSGTIALETLIFGYKSFVCGPRYNNIFAFVARTQEDWILMLQNDLKSILFSDKNMNQSIIQLARLNLYSLFGSKNLKSLCPSISIPPKATRLFILQVIISQLWNSIFLKNDLNFFARIPKVGEINRYDHVPVSK